MEFLIGFGAGIGAAVALGGVLVLIAFGKWISGGSH